MSVWVFLIGLALLVTAFEFTLNKSFIGSDDAYIHLRYIENLRDGHGFGFNPDQPSNGSTSPLWVMVAAQIGHGTDLPQEVKYLSIFLFVASIFVFYALSLQMSSSNVVALIATCIYASDAWLLKWAGSTMESSLASLLVISVAFFLMRSGRTGYLVITSLTMGLATLARPEISLLFALFLILHLANDGNLSAKLRKIFVASVIYSGVLVPWLLFTLLTFGSPIPNTFLAKTVASETTIWQVGWYFFRVIGLSYWWAWIIAFISLILFVINRIKNRLALTMEFQDRATALLWLWCAAIPVYYSVSKLQTPSTRYLQITTPILIAISFYGLTRLVSALSEKWHKARRQRLLLTSAAAGIIVFNVALNGLVVLPSSRDFNEGILQTYRIVGEWLIANTPEKSRVAVAIDVGTIGYYSHREIIDLGGLNTPEAIPYLPDSLRYVFVSKPQYLVVTGEDSQYKLLDQSRFKGTASPITSFPMLVGMRAALDQGTGGRENSERYVSVYRLSRVKSNDNVTGGESLYQMIMLPGLPSPFQGM